MECCSPDVGDCQKCHPELWVVTKETWSSWKPKNLRIERLAKSGFVG